MSLKSDYLVDLVEKEFNNQENCGACGEDAEVNEKGICQKCVECGYGDQNDEDEKDSKR